MSLPPEVLLATGNEGKVLEWTEILGAHGIAAVVRDLAEVEETGTTVQDNAVLKAVSASGSHHLPALGDDVAFEVEALQGAPGLRAKRWAMAVGGWAAARRRLVELAAGSPATFRCGVALALPDGSWVAATGVVHGTVPQAVGQGRAGFNPCFVPRGHAHPLSEIPADVRADVDHRQVAFRLLLSQIG
ncbi:MAG: non-canonical purine NTP pyrophosphatase [Myxococcales bacterium]|nr:non-canonical purine NTP pyrophosphatase [Myxococcales bacterium]